jgi:acyl carrier protein
MNSQDKVIRAISEVLGISYESLTPETRLSNVAHDSIKLFELFIRLENEMSGKLTYDQVVTINTISDVVILIDKYKAKK